MDSLSKDKQYRGAHLINSLPHLQSAIKRDPASYADDFVLQWNAYEAFRQLVLGGVADQASVKKDEQKWCDHVKFLAQTSPLYPKYQGQFIEQMEEIVSGNSGQSLGVETRKACIQALVGMRRRDAMDYARLLKSLFPVLSSTTSTDIRTYVIKTILSEIKVANHPNKNHKLNRQVQGWLYTFVERGMDQYAQLEGPGVKGNRVSEAAGGREALWAIKLASELWRKGIWTDARTVNLFALACFHPNTKVQNAALHFFLVAIGEDGVGGNGQDDSSDEESQEEIDPKKIAHQKAITKKRKSKERQSERKLKSSAKRSKRAALKQQNKSQNFSAIYLIHDPQGFAEKLYDALVKYDKVYTLDHRVLIMQLLGRVSGLHEVYVLGFYSYIVRYLTHHQLRITSILVALAQSIHELIPPDVITPVIQKIANAFVHPGVASEVNAAGINTIREICKRQPLAMEADLLGDLIQYRTSRDKGVLVAARSLLQLFREVNPSLLKRSERGKTATMAGDSIKPLVYGQKHGISEGIEGLDLLYKHMEEEKKKKEDNGEEDKEEDDDEGWDKWEEDSALDSDDSGGWIDVSPGASDIEFSDSDDENNKKPKKKKSRKDEEEDEEEEGQGSDNESGNDSEKDQDDNNEVNKEIENIEQDFLKLAQTKILTPADFAKLNELKIAKLQETMKGGAGSSARHKLAELQAKQAESSNDKWMSEAEIIGKSKRPKADYEERMASIQKGREDRDKFTSRTAKWKANKSSTTNEEKRKNKAFMMTSHSNKVFSKKNASLKEKSARLRNHKKKQKRRK